MNDMKKKQTIIGMRLRSLVLDNEGDYWSEEDHRKLLKAYTDGEDITEIALSLGRSETAIIQQIQLFRMKNMPSSHRKGSGKKKKAVCLCDCCECDPSCCPRFRHCPENKEEEKC